MMTDSRALTWQLLLPGGTGYTVSDGPDWWRASLAEAPTSGQRRALVCWGSLPGASSFPALKPYDTVIATNVKGLNGTQLRDAGFAHRRHFAVVPGLHDPRWFIPLESGVISARALDLYTPFDGLARLLRAGAWAAARTGLPFWYRDSIWVAQRTPSPIEALLYRTLGNRTQPIAISTGTPGPARKPTIAILQPNGNIRALAKISCSPLSRQLVRHEAESLQLLAERLDSTVRVPRLLASAELDGHYVTIEEALPGHQPGLKLTHRHERFLAALSGGQRRPSVATAIVSGFAARINEAVTPSVDLRPVNRRIHHLLNETAFPGTIVHGDFGPWNLRHHHGQLGAFDWEYCQLDGLPLLDEIHHRLQVGFLLKGWSDERAFEALTAQRATARTGVTSRQMLGLQLVYLLDVLLRRCEEGHPVDEFLRQRYVQVLQRMMATPNEAAI